MQLRFPTWSSLSFSLSSLEATNPFSSLFSFLPYLLSLSLSLSLSKRGEHLILFTSTLGTPTCHVLQRVEAGDLHSPCRVQLSRGAPTSESPLARWIVSRKRGARTRKHGTPRVSPSPFLPCVCLPTPSITHSNASFWRIYYLNGYHSGNPA